MLGSKDGPLWNSSLVVQVTAKNIHSYLHFNTSIRVYNLMKWISLEHGAVKPTFVFQSTLNRTLSNITGKWETSAVYF